MDNIKKSADEFNDYFVKVGSTLANEIAELSNKEGIEMTALVKMLTFPVESA